MTQAMFECVNRKRFNIRLTDVTQKTKKRLALLHKQSRVSAFAFERNAESIIAENAWLRVLSQAASVKSTTTVEDIQIFALSQVLRMADSRHVDKNQLSAWAKIVDLTKPGSLQTSK